MMLFMQLFSPSDLWQKSVVSVILLTGDSVGTRALSFWLAGCYQQQPLRPRALRHLEQSVKGVVEWRKCNLFRGRSQCITLFL